MADFTSALYLGLRHASATLPPWTALTRGQPAALAEPEGAEAAAAALPRLQGLAAATLLPSTLHLFWDLLRQLARETRSALLLDAGAYPILRWSAEGAAAAGAAVRRFAHHDSAALERLARGAVRDGLRPVVVCDGFCPGCNRPAPLAAYARIAGEGGGTLVLDDTQALGILGAEPSAACPFGHGGGGSLRWQGVGGAHIAVGASLAKGFGAPVAALSGSDALIGRFLDRSETRLHCSPPSSAAVAAARQAVALGARYGDGWRARLLRLVLRLRETLAQAGLVPVGRLPFPVQSFVSHQGPELAPLLWRRLQASGVRALLTRGCQELAPRLTFIVTALHRQAHIDGVAQLLARAGHAAAPFAPLAHAIH
ncbi:8-amino-7-oxononanoate synthase [Variovorax sp. J22R24]|uniref:aminotransferase class I/II-fold pyridoxal phosphate-dependent enzyme n=1 Tax=Variovorax gracilis TaxID=3053502 RepID=UPI0025754403|nr:aminotransferase class I/II-fold pyridoxal phosphate-dependent enzyme [Variovorax sp. J22R24]MDM0106069.1 8-amino-7-oxononanoate synthase [Variovorax sp. J22R24]